MFKNGDQTLFVFKQSILMFACPDKWKTLKRVQIYSLLLTVTPWMQFLCLPILTTDVYSKPKLMSFRATVFCFHSSHPGVVFLKANSDHKQVLVGPNAYPRYSPSASVGSMDSFSSLSVCWFVEDSDSPLSSTYQTKTMHKAGRKFPRIKKSKSDIVYALPSQCDSTYK